MADGARRSLPLDVTLLTVLAFAMRLWRLFTPPGRVWDEHHFEEYAARYFTGSYYVDVHPPLGKLAFALMAWVAGVPGDQLAQGTSFPVMRLLPAVAGALVVPTLWWLLRELGASRKIAAFGAALLLGDPLLLVESRLAVMDAGLVLCGVASVAAFLAARRSASRARWRWLALAALLAGAAVSIKWTGLSALGLIGAMWLMDARRSLRTVRRRIGEGALLLLVPAAVYLGSFAVHFALLPNDGAGTVLMSPPFAATRLGNPAYRPDARIGFLAEVGDLHRVMLSVNRGFETLDDPAASRWYTWPVAKHRMQIWQGDAGVMRRRIELLGNPVLLYGMFGVFLGFGAALATGWRAIGDRREALGLLGTAYLMNLLPFAFITRPMYLYHYATALVYGIGLTAVMFGALAEWGDADVPPWRFTSARGRAMFVGAVAVVLATFVYLAPLAYGTALSEAGLAARQIILERR